ncbi:MAG: prephenate dehydratase [Anaerolineales bacterium]|nr:prephenate dehydratase [Anaerolineales bacterium]
MTSVAFQGVAGAYSEQAARQFFGSDVETISCKTFEEIYTQVENSLVDFGMLPIENAVAGSVTEAYNLLMERDLRIHAEVIAHIHHMLMVVPGVKKSDIKRVCSHPQALAQCQRYLSRYGIEPVPAFDTAGSAAKLASEPNGETAVIASELAAELYGLEIIDPSIEDYPFNYTRFFVLSASSPPKTQRNKTTLFFTTPHDPGALYECLGEFAKRRVNLTKIESRPRLNQPWQYIFFLDFEGHCQDPECEAAIMGLLRRSTFVKLLGSYPAATTPVFEGQTT